MLELGELVAFVTTDDRPMEKGLKDSEGKFSSFGGKLGKMALAIGASAGLAIAGALAVSLTQAMDVEAANAKLAAQLGSTPAEAARLGKAAGDLYADNFGESIGQVNEAIKSVVNNIDGMRTAAEADLEDITGKVINLATTFELDLGQATRAVGKLVKTGLARDASEALDLLTVAFQNGTDEAGDLLDTVSEYSTQFRELGLSGQAALGLLQQGLKAGARDADTVADALKEFAIRAQDGSATTKAGFDALGLSAKKMAHLVASGDAGDALGLVLDRLRAIKDPVERNAAAVQLFGTKAEDLQDALYALDPDTAVQALGDVTGAAERMGDTLSGTAAAKIETFKRKASQKLTELGGGILGFFEDVAAKPEVQQFLGDAQRFIDDKVLPALSRVWTWVDQKVGPVLAKLTNEWLARGKEAWHDLEKAIEDNRPQLEQFAGWMEKIGDFVMNKVVPAVGPALTGGLAATIYWVKLFINTIAFWVDAFNRVKNGAGEAVDWTKNKINSLVAFVTGLPNRVRSAAVGLWDGLKESFRTAINWLISKWNNFELKIGGGSVLGVDIPSVTLSTPNIPMLAAGGVVPATPGGRIVGVAEAGEDEAIAPLSRLTRMIRDAVSSALNAGRHGVIELVIDLGEDIKKVIRINLDEYVRGTARQVAVVGRAA